MGRKNKALLCLIAAIFVLTQPAPASAGDAVHKLGRGLCNVATGWLEVPVQVMKTVRDTGHIAALTVGVVKGVFYGIGRTLVGAFETATFLAPIPAGYRPIVKPEFVLEPVSVQ